MSLSFFLMPPPPPTSTLFPYTTLFRSPQGVPVWNWVMPLICHPPSSLRARPDRSEEHTSELQSRGHLVCRLLLEKKKKYSISVITLHVTSSVLNHCYSVSD